MWLIDEVGTVKTRRRQAMTTMATGSAVDLGTGSLALSGLLARTFLRMRFWIKSLIRAGDVCTCFERIAIYRNWIGVENS